MTSFSSRALRVALIVVGCSLAVTTVVLVGGTHGLAGSISADSAVRDFLAGNLPETNLGSVKVTPVKAVPPNKSDTFFDQGIIPNLKIEIQPPEMDKLRQTPREYVRAVMTENDQTVYKSIGVKLKGAAGSFRGVDDRPALTIKADKYEKGQKFYDLEKFHLNNSVQDESYFQELIGAYIFKQAKVPAARVSHARVWLNGRDLGFYVFKEGFDKNFLKRHFDDNDGNLYDGGFCTDIDQALEKDSGKGVDDRSDLKTLIEVCREGDLAKRRARLPEVLDVEAFLRFYAGEMLTCHWDGYCRNRNNYRVYFDPKSKRAYFFPHGMDQLFGNPGEGMFDIHGAIVVQGVFQIPEYQDRYQFIVRELAPIVTNPVAIHQVVDKTHERIKPVLTVLDPNRANDNRNRADDLKRRLAERGRVVLEQLAQRPEPLRWDANGVANIPNDWVPKMETGDSVVQEAVADGKGTYMIGTGPSNRAVASWRRKAQLTRGKYKLQAIAKSADIVRLEEGTKGSGAGIRISGSDRMNSLVGTTGWGTLEFEFEIPDERREVELVLELRSTKGQVWFEKSSLRFVKVGN